MDKVLESKAKELLPKISEVVEKLRETKSKQSTQDTSSASEKNTQEAVSKAKPTDFGSLLLPIDIPGLTSSSSASGASPGTKKEPGEMKPVLKSKAKASESCSAKDKPKGKSGQLKVPVASKENLKKEKESVSEKEAVTEEGTKEKEKHKPIANQKKTKDEVKDKGTTVHKDKAQGVVEKVEQESQPSKPDKVGKSLPVSQQEQQHDSKKDSQVDKSECGDSEVQSDSKKVLPSRRRSARIASLSESVEESLKEEGDSPDEHPRIEERSWDKETVDKSVNEGTAKTKGSSKRKRKRIMKSQSLSKRQRLLSSSSDEEPVLVSSEDDSDQSSLADERKITSVSRKSVAKGRKTDNQGQSAHLSKKSRKRALQQASNEDTTSLTAQKKPRRSSKTFKDSATTEDLPPSEPLPAESVQKRHRRKSSQPHRLPVRESKSPPPPPVVVTRYNRQIKPNRRYIDPSGEQGEEGGEKDNETNEEKLSTQDHKETKAYSDIDSSDEGVKGR